MAWSFENRSSKTTTLISLSCGDESDNQKIAVDVKTTYRRFTAGGTWKAGFTLGSYTSFMRRNTKNIVFPYERYAKHYIIGFIYTRVEVGESKVFTLRKT